LTPLGQRLLDHGRDLLHRVDAAADDLDRFRSGDVGRLSVGAYQSVCSAVLPAVVGRLFTEHPELELRVDERDHDEALRNELLDGALDVAFLVTESAPGLEVRRLLTDPFVLIARPGQFPPGPVPATTLDGVPMIGQHPNSCQLLNEAGLRAAGAEPCYVFRTNDNGAVAAMVRAGMGVAVLPMLCVDLEDRRIELHPLHPPIPPRPVCIAWPASRTLATAARRFVELTVQVCDEVEASFSDRFAPWSLVAGGSAR
jgi:DNA-binding transcriptional LysR family regulator